MSSNFITALNRPEIEGWPYQVEPVRCMALDEGRSYLIHGNLSEDADRRVDNQYVWDLWSLAQRDDPVP